MAKKQTKKKKPSTLDPLEHFFLLPIEGPGRDDMMRLYAWDFDAAWKAQEEWESRNIQGRGPFFRWAGAQELKELYEQYRTKKIADLIIEALYVCSLNSLPIPRWCEMAFLQAYRRVRQYQVKSWDDIFDKPHPKGTHLGARRQKREKSSRVYNRIREIKQKDPSIAIDGNLFQMVGQEFGIGSKTLTEEYYYRWANLFSKRK